MDGGLPYINDCVIYERSKSILQIFLDKTIASFGPRVRAVIQFFYMTIFPTWLTYIFLSSSISLNSDEFGIYFAYTVMLMWPAGKIYKIFNIPLSEH